MIWKTAWKNIFRNRVRSIVVISSIIVGVFAGVFSVAVMTGAVNQRVDSALNEEISDIQITAKDFRINNDPGLIINNSSDLVSEIKKTEDVESICRRLIISGMANTATKSTGVRIVGINPDEERKVFILYNKIIEGTGDYFETESRYNLALIGQDLAKDLNIIRYSIDSTVLEALSAEGVPSGITDKLSPLEGKRFLSEQAFIKNLKSIFTAKEEKKYGILIKQKAWSFRDRSRLTLTFLDKDNNQVGAIFRLAGIYDITNTSYEKSTIFVKNDDLRKLTGFPEDSYHKLIVKLNDIKNTETVTDQLKSQFPDYEVMSWRKIQPDLAMLSDMMRLYYAVFMVIILAALAFGIVNTMLMVVLERTRELGMLTAIGMNKRRVFSMIMLESVFMSLIGGILGMIISYIIVMLTAEHGINFIKYAEGFEALGYSSHIYPEIDPVFFAEVVVLIIITGIISSIYPARKALKLDPAIALRTE